MNFINKIKKGLTGLLIISASQTIAQQANFSGNWRYNKDKSDLSAHPTYSFPAQLQVAMTADSISITAIKSGTNGKVINTPPAKYLLSGKLIEHTLQDSLKRLSSCQLSKNKRNLIKKSKITKGDETVKAVYELWTLSADGKWLNITLTEEDANQKPYMVTGIFETQ